MSQEPRSLLGLRFSQMTEEEKDALVTRLRAVESDIRRRSLHLEPRGGAAHEGYIFIQSHPAMPGLLRVGITSVADFDRSTDSSWEPYRQPLRLRKIVPVFMNLKEAEKRVFRAIVSFREKGNRQFYRLTWRQAVVLIEGALDGKDVEMH